MTTVYSLVCWGGRTGKTVSLSATTDIVTLTNHGLRNGAKLRPSGTLPSELNTSTPVYARSTGANTFTLHTSSAGAIANTGQITFAGSSTYAAVVLKSDLVADPANALAAYGLSDLSRWGASGSERIYDGLVSCHTARSSATNAFTDEVFEVGEAFDEITSTALSLTLKSKSTLIYPRINGVLTAAFHGGIIGGGYVYNYSGSGVAVTLSYYAQIVRGLDFYCAATNGKGASIPTNAVNGKFEACIIRSLGYANTGGLGATVQAPGAEVSYCLILGFDFGTTFFTYNYGYKFFNNLVAKCRTQGVYVYGGATTNVNGQYSNNISLSNGTNWQTEPSTIEQSLNNAGAAGNPIWDTGTTSIVVATADFVSFGSATVVATTDDFRPASISSPQVDAGTLWTESTTDLAANEVPNYNNGGAEYFDVGPYEFDHGYGPHPASHVLTLDNVVAGSRVFVRDQSGTVTHYDQIADASTVVITATVYGDSRDNWRIDIRQGSNFPYYQRYKTFMTATPGASSLFINQLPDQR